MSVIPLKIYLAGYIQGEVIEECKAWRKQLREHYEHWKGGDQAYPIVFLDPLNGEEMAEITADGLKSNIPPQSIVHRDYECVSKCDLIVVNMNTFGKNRPLTGTICELAWGWQLHKPIIMITDEDKYRIHPFTSYFASWIVKDMDELFEKKCINFFFKGWNNAIY
jgi:nucleoside 2-deoxyribosyltransferase